MYLFLPSGHPDRHEIVSSFPTISLIAEIHKVVEDTTGDADYAYINLPTSGEFIQGALIDVDDTVAFNRNFHFPTYLPVITMPFGIAYVPSYLRREA